MNFLASISSKKKPICDFINLQLALVGFWSKFDPKKLYLQTKKSMAKVAADRAARRSSMLE